MANKHEIQRDFEMKKKEWKENLKANHAIKLNDECTGKIKNAKVSILKDEEDEEYRKIVEEADRKIYEEHIKQGRAAIKASNELFLSNKQDEER